MLVNVANVMIRLSMDRFGRNLSGHIPSRPRHVRHDRLPWQRPLLSNRALNI